MRATLEKHLKSLGVTPWQFLLTIAVAGFYLGEMKPRLEAAEKLTEGVQALNQTVQALSTKVEVHAVILSSIEAVKNEVRDLRVEVAKLQPKTAYVPK